MWREYPMIHNTLRDTRSSNIVIYIANDKNLLTIIRDKYLEKTHIYATTVYNVVIK